MKTLISIILGFFAVGIFAAGELHEASMNFDLGEVRSFLIQLNSELGLDLDPEALSKFAAALPIDKEKSLHTHVDFKGESIPLEFRVFMDDIDSPDLYFFSPSKELIDSIDAQMKVFSEKLGI